MAISDFSISSLPYRLTTQNLKIGIAVAQWNREITDELRNGCRDVLTGAGLREEQIAELSVPGTFELAQGADWLLQTGCDAAICLGCVIQGETPHFDFVCKAATDGILQTALKTGKPAVFGVLTTLNMQQARERCGGAHGHKGREAAETALWMLAGKQNLNLTDL